MGSKNLMNEHNERKDFLFGQNLTVADGCRVTPWLSLRALARALRLFSQRPALYGALKHICRDAAPNERETANTWTLRRAPATPMTSKSERMPDNK